MLVSIARSGLSRNEIEAARKLIAALEPRELEHLSNIDPVLLKSQDNKGQSIIIQLASLLDTITADSANAHFDDLKLISSRAPHEIASATALGPDRVSARNLEDISDRLIHKNFTSHLEALEPKRNKAAPPPIARRELLSELLLELAYPLTTTQDQHGTCVAEVMSNMLFKEAPGKWTAMVIDLTEGKQAFLRLPEDIDRECPSRGRSSIARLVQSAILTTFAAEGFQYSNEFDLYFDRDDKSFASGVYTCEAATGLGKLLGKPHSMIDDAGILSVLLKAEELKFVTLEWDADEDHAVMVTEVKNGRVFFRNPHGPSNRVKGDIISGDGPTRTVEDSMTGIESMSEGDFLAKLRSAAVPTTTLIKPEIILSLCHTSAGRELLNNLVTWDTINTHIRGVMGAGAKLSNEERNKLLKLSITNTFGDRHGIAAVIGLYASVAQGALTPEIRKEILTLVNSDDAPASSARAIPYYLHLLKSDPRQFNRELPNILKEAVKRDDEFTFSEAFRLLNESRRPKIPLSGQARRALISGLTSDNDKIRAHALFGLRDLPYFGERFNEYWRGYRGDYGEPGNVNPYWLDVPLRSGISWSFGAALSWLMRFRPSW